MSSLTLRKAAREKTKMRVALVGPSGSGKTYSALVMASGMTTWDKIALIDTENGSGDLYAHLGPYSVITLGQPFYPERYIEAITACEAAGVEVIIIDSISHEWEGKGGILDIHDSMTGNSYTNWGKVTPRHNFFIQKIMQSKCHVIATMRAKQDYALTEKNGKQVPEKVGMKAVTRDGVDYEFTLVFDLNINHIATASKDRTGLFMNAAHDSTITEKVTKDTGAKLLEWTHLGIEPPVPTATLDQLTTIGTLAKELDIDMAAMYVKMGIKSPNIADADVIIKRLQQKKADLNKELTDKAVADAKEVMQSPTAPPAPASPAAPVDKASSAVTGTGGPVAPSEKAA